MHEAAQRLVGKHDFTTFRDTECQAKSPEKTLDQLDVVRDGDAVHIVDLGALVPAQPGALDGGLAGVGRRRPLERRRSCRSARRAQPRRLRPGRAAGRALSGAGGLLRQADLSASWPRSYPARGGALRPVRRDLRDLSPRAPRDVLDRPPSRTMTRARDSRKIPVQHPAIDLRQLLQIGHRRALVDLVHGLADQAELDHRAIARDEARIRGAAAGAQIPACGR